MSSAIAHATKFNVLKAQALDRLDVSSADSRRSSGISLPSRSVSQEARLHSERFFS